MLLNDVHHIRSIDKGDLITSTLGLPKGISEAMDSMISVDIPMEYSESKSIVVVGMGGSGIPGDFLRTIYRTDCSVPISVHKNYGLPSFVSDHTLVLVIGYSGTTEETLDAFEEALRRKAKIFGISTGDQLLKKLKENGIPHYIPPAGRTTRECVGYLLFSMVKVLERLSFVPDQGSNIRDTISLLENLSVDYAPETPVNDNEAKRIAAKLHNNIPILYGSVDLTDVVGLRWKHQINENSKVFAQLETFPDATHNQIAALANPHGVEKEFCAVILRNEAETPEMKKRIDATKEVLTRSNFDAVEHWAEGKSLMASLLSQSYLGDLVSLYWAVLNGVDPTPTKIMSELKNILGLTDLSP